MFLEQVLHIMLDQDCSRSFSLCYFNSSLKFEYMATQP